MFSSENILHKSKQFAALALDYFQIQLTLNLFVLRVLTADNSELAFTLYNSATVTHRLYTWSNFHFRFSYKFKILFASPNNSASSKVIWTHF